MKKISKEEYLQKMKDIQSTKHLFTSVSENQIIEVTVVNHIGEPDEKSGIYIFELEKEGSVYQWEFRDKLYGVSKTGEKKIQQYNVKGCILAQKSYETGTPIYMLYTKKNNRSKVYHYFATKEEAENYLNPSKLEINRFIKIPDEREEVVMNLNKLNGEKLDTYIEKNKEKILKFPDLVKQVVEQQPKYKTILFEAS